MNFNSLFCARLQEERKRLKLDTQAEAASACGVSREMWGKYERGVALMGTDVLYRFAELGADVGYLITGQKNKKPVGKNENVFVFEPDSKKERFDDLRVAESPPPWPPGLAPREEALLDNYRASGEEGKRAVEATAHALAQQEKQGKVGRGKSKK